MAARPPTMAMPEPSPVSPAPAGFIRGACRGFQGKPEPLTRPETRNWNSRPGAYLTGQTIAINGGQIIAGF